LNPGAVPAMDMMLRFVLRFILIPLGVSAAALAMAAVVTFVYWSTFWSLIANDPSATDDAVATFVIGGPLLFLALSLTALAMMLPGMLGIAVAEIIAIRTWLYYAAIGGLAAWIGWTMLEDVRKAYEFFREPTLVVAAGIAGGIAYWAVAGWSAGFWKPVFASNRPPG
jgi:hypothetical protein